MTKANEIALLDKTIKAFGAESYLGPWLAAHRDEIVRDITSDMGVSMTPPAECYRVSNEMIACAKAEAALIIEAAQKAARAREDVAVANIQGIRDRARRELQAATDRI